MSPTKQFDSATCFNSFIACHAVFAMGKLSLLDEAIQRGVIDVKEVIRRTKADHARLVSILDTAKTLGWLYTIDNNQDIYIVNEIGKDVFQHAGFFTWCVGGYSRFLLNTAELCLNAEQSGMNLIDGKYVALGSDQCNVQFMENTINATLSSLSFNTIADLGCGNGGRLIQFAQQNTSLRGIGVDINPDAVSLARANINKHNLTERLECVCTDVFSAIAQPLELFQSVEVVTSFMMLHDLLNIESIRTQLFPRLRAAFPAVKYFVIGDTMRAQSNISPSDLPVFALGFELIHKLRHLELFDLEYYKSLFEDAGLLIETIQYLNVPNTYLFLLKVR
jgi:SAM-dependent methyltransferase